MPITDNIIVVVQAHLLPFHNYKSYRYVRPNAKNAMPIPTKKSTAPLARILFRQFLSVLVSYNLERV